MVTLTGVGGIGKSRLALEASIGVEDSYSEGVCWIDLAPLGESGGVAASVAAGLGVQASAAEDLIDRITSWLADREELLILDNCEHVLSEAAGLVDVLTVRCPGITVLATSRSPLGLPGEIVWPMRALSPTDSSALFEERLFELDANLTLGAQDRETVARICDRVDGHPLAIEMAAAQVRSRSFEDILAVLPRTWEGGGVDDVPERHRSLDGNIEWSVRLLDDGSRELFENLSVFPSGFDPSAVPPCVGTHPPNGGSTSSSPISSATRCSRSTGP